MTGIGRPDVHEHSRTIGELRAAGYEVVSVREEMRRNLIARLAAGEPILEKIVGYGDTVVPDIENAILAGHHIVFLGERGQGKSRIMRGLMSLLDETVPAIAGCEINDDPFRPLCKACRAKVAESGDAVPVEWISRERRYGEKLATPDASMADLIGEIDPIKVAEGRYLADEETIHYGLVPRTNRGIFAINELPDLTEKVQVGLFNLMEEKDIQIKGYKIRLPLDIVLLATANPEDYTSRGRIITPLKDRFDVQIRTHYPRTIADEMAIVDLEVPASDRDGRPLRVPEFIKELLAQLTMEARASDEINQASGVSVRASINNYESVISNAEKAGRALPRVRDRAADYRPARDPALDGGEDRARVCRRRQAGGRSHRSTDEPCGAQSVRSGGRHRGAGEHRRVFQWWRWGRSVRSHARGRLSRGGTRHPWTA